MVASKPWKQEAASDLQTTNDNRVEPQFVHHQVQLWENSLKSMDMQIAKIQIDVRPKVSIKEHLKMWNKPNWIPQQRLQQQQIDLIITKNRLWNAALTGTLNDIKKACEVYSNMFPWSLRITQIHCTEYIATSTDTGYAPGVGYESFEKVYSTSLRCLAGKHRHSQISFKRSGFRWYFKKRQSNRTIFHYFTPLRAQYLPRRTKTHK